MRAKPTNSSSKPDVSIAGKSQKNETVDTNNGQGNGGQPTQIDQEDIAAKSAAVLAGQKAVEKAMQQAIQSVADAVSAMANEQKKSA